MTRIAHLTVLRLLPSVVLALAASCGEPAPDEAPVIDCDPGSLGCACASADTCGTSTNGEALRCMDAVCVPTRCAPGDTGCVCRAGTTCSEANDACVAGVCKPVGCAAGALSCDCLVGTCGAGLYCDDAYGSGTCVDDAGFAGGECLPNGLCHNQSRCDHDSGTCVPCELGSQGCAPNRGVCNVGLVYAVGRCLPRHEVPPDAPKCYTPCSTNVSTSAGVMICDAEGFLPGCLPNMTCTDGTCVADGATRPTCTEDAECPEHQACLADGHCYSNCDVSADCPVGLACHQHVCRMPCEATPAEGHTCPEGNLCDMEDGQNGYCMPQPTDAASSVTSPDVTTTYALTDVALTLPVRGRNAETRIVSRSPVAQRFTVTRRSHRAFNRQGVEVVDPRAREPLWFLSLSSAGATRLSGGALDVTAPPNCAANCPTLIVAITETLPSSWSRFEGTIEVAHASMGTQTIDVAFHASVDGRWTGTMYYFASFPDVGLELWRSGDRSTSTVTDGENTYEVGNALIAKWVAYRNGRLDTFDHMQAVLGATANESWRWPSVMSRSSSCAGLGACYLVDAGGSSLGFRQYATNLAATPIPTGVTQYPIALNLRPGPLNALGHFTLTGTIDSAVALHYGGNPRIDMAFATRPDDTSTARCDSDMVPGDCVSLLSDLRADVLVGARSASATASCVGADLSYTRIPWLVPGFTEGTRGGYREECRETAVPFAAGNPRNANLTVGNPVADGHSLRRQVRLMDGAMIDQHQLFVIFEETLESSVRDEPIKTYGYMLLERSDQDVADTELATSTTGTSTRAVTDVEPRGRTSCTDAIERVEARLPAGVSLPSNMTDLARATLMLTGRLATATPIANVHYLCVDTGLIDGGPRHAALSTDELIQCPSGSNVRYFALPAAYTQEVVAGLACQGDATCGAQVQSWLDSSLGIVPDPTWSCTDGTPTGCTVNRYDLRVGKVFYAPGSNAFPPLAAEIEHAFRYKTRFRGTRDRSVGFSPVPCEGNGDLTPYCYDAAAIEDTVARVDCLLRTYADNVEQHTQPQWAPVRAFLSSALSVLPSSGLPSAPAPGDGFERANAELLIMLGDEAMTHALGSRFDLAASNGASFLGAQFEAGGINVGGIAGYEMRELQKAVQYYEMTTERFFTHVAPVIFAAIEEGDVGVNRVASPLLVSSYLERLIGGSTKKAAAWSYIADRYRGFNRPDLARAVIQRAYMGTYIESMILSRMMLDIATQTDHQNRNGIISILERTQRSYASALARMSEVNASITNGDERFGFSPDDIPFPAVDDADTRFNNAFESVLGLARLRMETARRFEEDAIATRRSFETDSASFQSELVQISVDRERRLSEICGAFTGDDGRVHPAIARYAERSARTLAIGDPCGFVGNGAIYERTESVTLQQADVTEFGRRIGHLDDRIDHENERVASQCGRLFDLRDLQVMEMGERRSLRERMTRLEDGVGLAQRVVGHVGQAASMATCTFVDCLTTPGKVSGYLAAAAVSEITIAVLQDQIVQAQSAISLSEEQEYKNQIDSECDSLEIDLIPVLHEIDEQVDQLEHDIRQTNLRVQVDTRGIQALRLEAARLEQEREDAERLAIDVEAARNDPNVRVYMNAAMINADRSFNRALEHAFRATRLLEYFKSESYENADELYLIRMISRGEYNLESYLDDLEDDYEAFRVRYRTRSNRAVRLSLTDDIMMIPVIDEDGHALSTDQRTRMMRERLLDPTRLDASGRRTFEFRTAFEQFAPCTFGHQINYVEVMFSGSNLGDANSSVMLWQDGTGIIGRADGDQNFHRLPPALIVATPRRDLDMAFDPSVYRNYGMRERPLVNTSWRLVFDELHPQNADVRFEKVNDVFVYIYYTDFTNPSACR